MKNKPFFLILLFLISQWTFGQEQKQELSSAAYLMQANQLYQEGKYQQAATLYQKLEDTGQTSASLQYNMGNAYYKADDIANAMLHYERALHLSPKDNDIQHNIDFARKSILFKAETYPLIFYKRWLKNLVNTFSSTIWLLLATLLVWAALYAAYRFLYGQNRNQRKRLFALGSFITFCSLLCLIFGFIRYSWETQKDHAIIFAQEPLQIKTGPSDDSQTQFKLSAGNKVKIADELDDWTKILLEDDKEGWIESKYLVRI